MKNITTYTNLQMKQNIFLNSMYKRRQCSKIFDTRVDFGPFF